jgi:hypothetical protein
LVNFAYRTGDTEPLQRASSEACKTCQNTIETVETQYGSGGRFEAGQIEVNLAVPVPGARDVFPVSAQIDQQPLRKINADGSPGETSDGEQDLALTLTVGTKEGDWSMLSVAPGQG